MADYIERKAAKAAIQQALCDGTGYGEALNAIPATDVRRVVRGRWMNVVHAAVDTTGDCSECEEEAVWRTWRKPYAICPNCGADMRAEE